MSVAGDIRNVRKAFRKLDPSIQGLALDLIQDDLNQSRAANARAAKGKPNGKKGGRPKGSKNGSKNGQTKETVKDLQPVGPA